jgi:fatty acid desaturase
MMPMIANKISERFSSAKPRLAPFAVGYAAWIMWAIFWWKVHPLFFILIGVPIGLFVGAFACDAYHRRFKSE